MVWQRRKAEGRTSGIYLGVDNPLHRQLNQPYTANRLCNGFPTCSGEPSLYVAPPCTGLDAGGEAAAGTEPVGGTGRRRSSEGKGPATSE